MIEKRPFFFAVSSLVLGEVYGQYAKGNMVFPILFLFAGCGILWWRRKKILLCDKKKEKKQRMSKIRLFLFFLIFLFGAIHHAMFAMQFQMPKGCYDGKSIRGVGKIVEKQEGQYGITYRCQRPTIFIDTELEYEDTKEERRKALKGDLLLYGSEENLKLGQHIVFQGVVKELKEPTNPGQFNQKQYQRARGVIFCVNKVKIERKSRRYSRLLEGLEEIKRKINNGYQQVLSKKSAGLLMAMVTGEKSELDAHIKQLYQEQGIAHILAISGLHIALVGRNLFQNMRKRGMAYLISGGSAIGFLVLYCLMIGKSASVVRAFVMLVVFLAGEIIGRSYDMLTAMSVSAGILILQNPYCIMDTGFLLSFGAILGIGICYPVYFKDIVCKKEVRKAGSRGRDAKKERKKSKEKYKKKNGINKRTGEIKEENTDKKKIWRGLKESFFISLSIQMVTFPVLIHTFYGISVYSIFLNLFVIPSMSLLLPSAMIGGVMSLFSFFWAKVFLYPAIFFLNLYELLCEMMDHIPYSFYITGEQPIRFYVIYYAVLIIVGILLQKKEKKKIYVVLFLSLVFLCFDLPYEVLMIQPIEDYKPMNRQKRMRIICADVGQGDGLVFQLPTHHVYLLDGGSTDVKDVGTYRLLPLLHYYGITSVEGAIVTHLDADHYNGMKQLFGEVKIKTLFLPKLKEKDEEYIGLERVALQYGTKIQYLGEGDRMKDGEVEFTWLSPARNAQKDNRNDNSQVFFLQYKEFCGVFTGDMGEDREEELLEQVKPCTVLKVGHHGSKHSSSSAFLEKVCPKYALISYGVGNRYGHPNIETIERLQKQGTKIYETGKSGAIFIETDGERLNIHEFRCEKGQ